MKVLLIETAPGAAASVTDQLVEEGHTVVSCNDDHGGPCRGVTDHVDCPLQSHIDLAVVARHHGEPATLNEMGSICASQRHIPIVEVDPATVDDEMSSVVVAGALAARRVEAAYAAAVRHELASIDCTVVVHRGRGQVHATVKLAGPAAEFGPGSASSIADRARHAIRTFDPFVNSIDVSVATNSGSGD